MTVKRKHTKATIEPGMRYQLIKPGEKFYTRYAGLNQKDFPDGATLEDIAIAYHDDLPKTPMFIPLDHDTERYGVELPVGMELVILQTPRSYKPRQNIVTFLVRDDENPDLIHVVYAFWSIFRPDTICIANPPDVTRNM